MPATRELAPAFKTSAADWAEGSWSVTERVDGSWSVTERVEGSWSVTERVDGSWSVTERVDGSWSVIEPVDGVSCATESRLCLTASLKDVLLEVESVTERVDGVSCATESKLFLTEPLKDLSLVVESTNGAADGSGVEMPAGMALSAGGGCVPAMWASWLLPGNSVELNSCGTDMASWWKVLWTSGMCLYLCCGP